MKYANNITELIGNTPLVKLQGASNASGATVLGKCEFMNPSHSVKDRIGTNMINAALKAGLIKEGTTVIEPTSGNTGISLALIARLKGYNAIIVMPDSMSVERRSIMTALGAELILTDGSKGMKGAIEKAEELIRENKNYFMPQQFENSANPQKHYETTGVEIIEDLPDLDAFVVGVGTGGTISGFGQYIKDFQKETKVYGVEPEESAVLSGENTTDTRNPRPCGPVPSTNAAPCRRTISSTIARPRPVPSPAVPGTR